MDLRTTAVVFEQPERLAVRQLQLTAPGAEDVVVDVDWSGISTGTERLLWHGHMPAFPGMGYPLVPGYESVGRVAAAGAASGRRSGERVFVPGARCYGDVRGLFGGAASRLVAPGARVVPVADALAEEGVLLALAATAHHALVGSGGPLPELVVGHGVLGRLLARLTLALGGDAPVVWEHTLARRGGAAGYPVVAPEDDPRTDYAVICDASGDAGLLDALVARLRRGGEIVLAGFYRQPVSFAFPPAFMRELRLRVAAEWAPGDLEAVAGLVRDGRLSLEGLVTHRHDARAAALAYPAAFGDPDCLKMVLDWRTCS